MPECADLAPGDRLVLLDRARRRTTVTLYRATPDRGDALALVALEGALWQVRHWLQEQSRWEPIRAGHCMLVRTEVRAGDRLRWENSVGHCAEITVLDVAAGPEGVRLEATCSPRKPLVFTDWRVERAAPVVEYAIDLRREGPTSAQ